MWPESSSRGVVGSGERLEGFATRSLGRKEEKGSGRKPGLAPPPLLPNPLYAQTQRSEQGGRRDLSDTRFNIGQYFFKKNLVGNMRGRRFQMSSCSVKIPTYYCSRTMIQNFPLLLSIESDGMEAGEGRALIPRESKERRDEERRGEAICFSTLQRKRRGGKS